MNCQIFLTGLAFVYGVWYNTLTHQYLPVAQLDSASDSDSEGQRFESARVGQKFGKFRLAEFFIHCESNGISSRFSVYLITEGAYHQPQAVFTFAMMIYNDKSLMIYKAYALMIYTPWRD